MAVLTALLMVPPTGLQFESIRGQTVATTGTAMRTSVAPPAPTNDAPPLEASSSPATRTVAWTSLSLTSPGDRAGAGLGALASNGDAVLFGGATPAGLVNTTVLYNETRNTWTTLAAAGAPSSREDSGFATDAVHRTAVLFGGLVNTSTGRAANDTWAFSFTNETWSNISQGVAPDARSDAAFAVGVGVALLYGGREANANGVGELIYNDTWTLNLSTDRWTHVAVTGPTPGTLFGGSLLWDPGLAVFLLFGGCYPCSSTVWTFSPSTSAWSQLTPSGITPTARMMTTWAWDPIQQEAILFGGTNSTKVFNDTYLFDPDAMTWNRVATPPAPSPRYHAASDFLDAPGNATLLLMGGFTGVAPLADTWRLAPVADLTVEVRNASSRLGIANATVGVGGTRMFVTNLSGAAFVTFVPSTELPVNASAPGFAPLGQSIWVGPASNSTLWLNLTALPPATVAVNVSDALLTPIANASVTLYLDGRLYVGSPRLTDPAGVVVFTDVPVATAGIFAGLAAFHSNSTLIALPPAGLVAVNLTLTPLLKLDVHTTGKLPGGNVSDLGFVHVTVQGLALGVSNATGWVNNTTVAAGVVEVEGTAFGFAPGFANFTALYSGVTVVSLGLVALPYAQVAVVVFGVVPAAGSVLVQNAVVSVASIPPLPIGRFGGGFVTAANGTATFVVPAGNYSLTVQARGFSENASVPVVRATAAATLDLDVELVALPPASLDVLVVSAVGDHLPILGATVAANYSAIDLRDGQSAPLVAIVTATAMGWANYSALPMSELELTVSAPGYLNNSSILFLDAGEHLGRYLVELTPAPPPHYTNLEILAGDPIVLIALILLPALTLAGALVYLTMLRNPTSADRSLPKRERSGPESGPPSGSS